MKKLMFILANEDARKPLRFTAIAHNEGFANEFTASNEIGRIRMPYGEYEYGEVKCPDGKTRKVMQVWDEASAKAIRDALPTEGYPVYQGHPDVPDVAHKYPNKAAIGWITGIELADGAAILSVEWIENPGKGFKWFSPYWCGDAEVEPDSSEARVHVSTLTSVGLVNNPRIKQFTLANEWGEATAASAQGGASATSTQKKGESNMDIAKLAALLGLPTEGLTEEQIVAEITKLQQAAVAAADTAKAQVEAAKAETTAVQGQIAEKDKELANAKTCFANERNARIELLLDNAIAGGNITPAGKPAWKARLEKDIDEGMKAMFNEHAVKVTAQVSKENAEQHNKGKTLLELANEMVAKDGMDFTKAFLKAKAEHPELVK